MRHIHAQLNGNVPLKAFTGPRKHFVEHLFLREGTQYILSLILNIFKNALPFNVTFKIRQDTPSLGIKEESILLDRNANLHPHNSVVQGREMCRPLGSHDRDVFLFLKQCNILHDTLNILFFQLCIKFFQMPFKRLFWGFFYLKHQLCIE